MTIETKDIITLFGIGITFIVSSISLYVSLHNTKKTLYINSITSSRIRWIGTLRENISDYCGLIHHYALTDIEPENEKKIFEQIDRLRYLIKLQLNRGDKFDSELILKIDTLWELSESDQFEKIKSEIDELISLTQDLLKLEWEGAKLESMKGILTQEEKNKLYEKYLRTKKYGS
jgi:hypothetical protein